MIEQEIRPLAVVTGASRGIGYELAKRCVEEGFDLLIAADEPQIHEAAQAFRQMGARVEAMQADLATREGVDSLYEAARHMGRVVDALLAKAERGPGRGFLDQAWDDILRVLDTNITGTIRLIHKVGRDMREHGRGRILIVDPVAGPAPGAVQAVYIGTKAFLDSFSSALRDELKDTGVTVTRLAPGPEEREGDPVTIARAGFEAMMRGEGEAVSGLRTTAGAPQAGPLQRPG